MHRSAMLRPFGPGLRPAVSIPARGLVAKQQHSRLIGWISERLQLIILMYMFYI